MVDQIPKAPTVQELLAALPDALLTKLEQHRAQNPLIALSAMLYNPITDKAVKDTIQREFQQTAEPNFLRYLAATQPEILKSIGLNAYAIDCMRKGMLPHNEEGKPYRLNVDHIMDRAGCGHAGLEPTDDGVLKVNAKSNMVLIDRGVHDLKTQLVNDQTQSLSGPKWIVTLVPEGYPEHPIQIVCPYGAETEELGRPVWLYRAKSASSYYRQAIEKLVQSVPGQAGFEDLLREATDAFEVRTLMWQWAEKAHVRKENQIRGTTFEDLDELRKSIDDKKQPGDKTREVEKETRNFLKARSDEEAQMLPLYVSVYDPKNYTHLQRQFQESNLIGSHFYPLSEGPILKEVEQYLFAVYAQDIREGRKPGRVEHSWDMPNDIGEDAVVHRDDVRGSSFTVRRDPGTPLEAVINVVAVERVPPTRTVSLIGGLYGLSGMWGVHTLYPGKRTEILPGQVPDTIKNKIPLAAASWISPESLDTYLASTFSALVMDTLTYPVLANIVGRYGKTHINSLIPPPIVKAIQYWEVHCFLATTEKLRANGIEEFKLRNADVAKITPFRGDATRPSDVGLWIDTRINELASTNRDCEVLGFFRNRLNRLVVAALELHPDKEQFNVGVLSSLMPGGTFAEERMGINHILSEHDDNTIDSQIYLAGSHVGSFTQSYDGGGYGDGFDYHIDVDAGPIKRIFDTIPEAIDLTAVIHEKFGFVASEGSELHKQIQAVTKEESPSLPGSTPNTPSIPSATNNFD